MAQFITVPGNKIKKFRARFSGHNTESKTKGKHACGSRPKNRTLPHHMKEVDLPGFSYQPVIDTSNGISCGSHHEWADANDEHFIAI